ncbi:hypothetical protein LJR118_002886 [Acidovorax sp. LjRoot118]|uniref:hypothetical protein n=1 Tax=Acidovorax sp. LjRoot118 TaxID=3342256 RepID=UPI003ECF219C
MQFDSTFASTLLTIAAGALGYCLATFWLKPMVLYIELRSKVLSDLVYYANVQSPEGLVPDEIRRGAEGHNALRRHAGELAACDEQLPAFYKGYLRLRGRSLSRCSELLIGLSNTVEFDMADKKRKAILDQLGAGAHLKATL